MDTENEELKKRIIELENENEKLKKSLENYNNSRKSYYEKNKEIIKEKALTRLKKLSEENPERPPANPAPTPPVNAPFMKSPPPISAVVPPIKAPARALPPKAPRELLNAPAKGPRAMPPIIIGIKEPILNPLP